jgi:hypothetical protein
MSRTKTEGSSLGKEWNLWERWASGNVAKASWRKIKGGDDAELKWFWARGSLL